MVRHLRYEIFPELRHLPEFGNYIAYGLCCFCMSVNGAISHGAELQREPDVTTDRNFAEQLAFRFETGQADPHHLHALLEDML